MQAEVEPKSYDVSCVIVQDSKGERGNTADLQWQLAIEITED